MENRIEYLLQKYLEGNETEEEILELMELIGTGDADKIVRDTFSEEFEKRFKSGEEPNDWEKIQLQIILDNIKPKLQSVERKQSKSAYRYPARFSARKGDGIIVLKRMIAVAALMLMAFAGAWVFVVTQEGVTDEHISQTYTGAQQVTLPDESVVLLNEGSSLTLKNNYGEIHREVWLEGEGFFDVRNEASTPFIVRTGEISTTVLGTSFNIKAGVYDDEITVTVSRGIVEVGDAEQVYGRLLADEQLAVNLTTRKFEKSGNGVGSAFEWKKRFIILDNIALSDAVDIIGERFGVRITITNEDLRQAKVSATFLQEEGLEHIIQSISLITQSSYSINGNQIEITGGMDMN